MKFSFLAINTFRFEDLLGSDASEHLFTHAAEIFNPSFNQDKNTNKKNFVAPVVASAVAWKITTMMFLAFLYMRQRSLAALLQSVAAQAQLVMAHDNHVCNLPAEVFWMQGAILALLLMGIIPRIIAKVLRLIENLYIQQVEDAAARIALEERA